MTASRCEKSGRPKIVKRGENSEERREKVKGKRRCRKGWNDRNDEQCEEEPENSP